MSKAFCLSILLPLAAFPALSSAEAQPDVTPVLIGEIIPVFYSDQETDAEKGWAKALISLNGGGKVIKVSLLEVEPKTLEHKSIVQAIKGAKFNLPESERKDGVEDFLFTFSFNFLEESLNMNLTQSSLSISGARENRPSGKDTRI